VGKGGSTALPLKNPIVRHAHALQLEVHKRVGTAYDRHHRAEGQCNRLCPPYDFLILVQ